MRYLFNNNPYLSTGRLAGVALLALGLGMAVSLPLAEGAGLRFRDEELIDLARLGFYLAPPVLGVGLAATLVGSVRPLTWARALVVPVLGLALFVAYDQLDPTPGTIDAVGQWSLQGPSLWDSLASVLVRAEFVVLLGYVGVVVGVVLARRGLRAALAVAAVLAGVATAHAVLESGTLELFPPLFGTVVFGFVPFLVGYAGATRNDGDGERSSVRPALGVPAGDPEGERAE